MWCTKRTIENPSALGPTCMGGGEGVSRHGMPSATAGGCVRGGAANPQGSCCGREAGARVRISVNIKEFRRNPTNA